MIRMVRPAEVKKFKDYCLNDPFGCKLSSLITAYGTEERFADFWFAADEDESITAVIGRLEATVTVCCKGDIPEEVFIFAGMLPDIGCIESKAFTSGGNASINSNTASKNTAKPPHYILTENRHFKNGGAIMRHNSKKNDKFRPESDNTSIIINDNLYSLYTILCQINSDFSAADAGAFYVDLHRRIQCGVMATALIKIGDTPAACAIASLSGDSVLISSVACVEQFRGKSLATQAVTALTERVNDKNIYLFCREDMQGFYSRMGFETVGEYFEGTQDIFHQ